MMIKFPYVKCDRCGLITFSWLESRSEGQKKYLCLFCAEKLDLLPKL